jgi:6-pyruvoyltetrahydropterin/6-carboxytetrahydropterin synthase
MSKPGHNAISIVQRFEWDAMHRIPGHEGICKAYHGHRYAAEFTLAAEKLDKLDRVVDFFVVEEVIGGWIKQHFDHTAILCRNDDEPSIKAVIEMNARLGRPAYLLDGYPTVEVIAAELGRIASELMQPHGVRVVSVRLWETPESSAVWTV